MNTKFNASRGISGAMKTHASSLVNNDGNNNFLQESNAKIYPCFSGLVLDLSTYNDSTRIVDIIGLANNLQAAEIRTRDLSFAKKLIPNGDRPKVIKKIRYSSDHYKEPSVTPELTKLDSSALSSLRDYYNRYALNKLGDLDPISLNGFKSLVFYAGIEVNLLLDNGKPIHALMRDQEGGLSILNICESEGDCTPLLEHFLFPMGKNDEQSIFLTDAQTDLEYLIKNRASIISEEIMYGISRYQYCDFEHELTKLPRVFLQTTHGPVFGTDY